MDKNSGCNPKTCRVLVVLGILLCSSPQKSRAVPVGVDLRPYGFSVGEAAYDLNYGLFYISANRVVVYFDQKLANLEQHSHSFRLLVLSVDGQVLAQRVILADPKAMDITAGPNGGVLFGRAGQLDFFDADLRLVKSRPLPESVAAIAFDRVLNQLVEVTADPVSQTQSAYFIDGNTLEELLTLTYPIKGIAKFGEKQLAYTLGGNCVGSAHVVADTWVSLSTIPACDLLTFIGNNSIAYAFDQQVYILDSTGKQLLVMHIPAADTFQAPSFVGLSDDHARLAIKALKKKLFANGKWPYYDEIFVYDLPSKHLMFRHSLPVENYSAALSPDGSHVVVIEEGTLRFIPVS